MKKIIIPVLIAAFIFSLTLNIFAFEAKSEKADALYFNVKPVIDGVISAEEWGEPTCPDIQDNEKYPSVFSMREGDTGLRSDKSATPNEKYSMWLRWDEEYFYLALTTPDTKPFHQYADGSGEFWNGDVIQFGTDSGGNWEMQGNDKENAWGPGYKLHLFAKCSNDKKDYAYSYNYTPGDDIKYAITNDGKITTYEVAIPWNSYITDDVSDIKAGKIIGFAMVVLFADDATDYYGWLGWGDNICYNQLEESRVGNNAITLSSVNAIAESTESPADENVKPSPETSDSACFTYISFVLISLAGMFLALKMRKTF